jgi:hypothetical protein
VATVRSFKVTPGKFKVAGIRTGGNYAQKSITNYAEVKNGGSCTSIPQYVFMAWYLVKHRDNFTFILVCSSSWPNRKEARHCEFFTKLFSIYRCCVSYWSYISVPRLGRISNHRPEVSVEVLKVKPRSAVPDHTCLGLRLLLALRFRIAHDGSSFHTDAVIISSCSNNTLCLTVTSLCSAVISLCIKLSSDAVWTILTTYFSFKSHQLRVDIPDLSRCPLYLEGAYSGLRLLLLSRWRSHVSHVCKS